MWPRRSMAVSGHSCAPADQSRRDHARIIHDQQFVAAKHFRQLAESAIFPAVARAVQKKQPRGVAFGQRMLRDQRSWQDIIEFGKLHRLAEWRSKTSP